MKYYDDIRFVMGGAHTETGRSILKGRWPDFYSIQFDRSNRIFYEVDGEPIDEINAPAVYLTHPEKRYRFGSCDDSPWYHTCIGFTGPRAKRIVDEGFYRLFPSGITAVHRPHKCAEVFDSILDIYQSKDPARHFEAVIKLEQFLGLLINNQQMHAPEMPFAEEIKILADRIEAAPFEGWDFKQCAEELSISHSHFRKLFRAHIKQAPHDYLLATRMQRAAKLLEQTNRSVKEICYQCNYTDLAQFSKVFKKQIGISPRHFRDSLRLGLPHSNQPGPLEN